MHKQKTRLIALQQAEVCEKKSRPDCKIKYTQCNLTRINSEHDVWKITLLERFGLFCFLNSVLSQCVEDRSFACSSC